MAREGQNGKDQDAAVAKKGKVGVIDKAVHQVQRGGREKRVVESATFPHNVQTRFLGVCFCQPCPS